MSEPENFVARWSRLKRETAKEQTGGRCGSIAPAAGRDSGRWRGRGAQAASAGSGRAVGTCLRSGELPPIESITAGQRHPGLSAVRRAGGIDQGGAAARLDNRSGDPRFHRHRREPVGLHRSHGHAGLRSARSHRRRSRTRCPGHGETGSGRRRPAAEADGSHRARRCFGIQLRGQRHRMTQPLQAAGMPDGNETDVASRAIAVEEHNKHSFCCAAAYRAREQKTGCA